ncbi:MAG: endonuclease III [Chloroflexi bacterium]|nr:endonuclease III [Chloroflexota bacterium]
MENKLQKQKLARIASLLKKKYGAVEHTPEDPLEVLVGTILSQNTSDKNSEKAFLNLKKAVKNFKDLLSMPPGKIASLIKAGGLSNIKEKRIRESLEMLRRRDPSFSLSFLVQKDSEQAMKFLSSLPGVGDKTAACVLLFSFSLPVMPVDTHVFRIGKRTGVIPERASLKKAHNIFSEIIPAEYRDVLDLHVNLITHGREVCKAVNPACPKCVIRPLCDYYNKLKQDAAS